MGARYYEPKVKRFLSQDPAHLLVGDYRFEDKFGVKLTDHIANPQKLNTYTYTINNPLRFKDEQGAIPVDTVLDVGMAVYDVGDLGYNLWQGDMEGAKGSLKNLALDLASIALPYVSFSGAKGAVFVASITRKAGGGGGPCLNCVKNAGQAFVGSYKSLTSGNFRHNLAVRTGTMPEGSQAHHILPQASKFQAWFKQAGIDNIHDPKYGTWWESTAHQKNATAYNQSWEKFRADNPYAKKSQIEKFGKNLAKDYGLKVQF